MGLLRKLLGREPAWLSSWEVYPGEVADRLAMYNVDLGAVDAAPVGRLPLRLDVEFDYRGDGASGMPDADELAAIHLLDDDVHRTAEALRGAVVGRVLTDNTGRITAYLPEGANPPPLSAPAGLSPRVTVTPDPAWTRVRDELTPDAWQRNVVDDGHVVQQLEAHGDRLSVPRQVEFLAYFPDPDRAEAAAAELRAEGFTATFQRDDEGEYVLQAIRVDPVELPAFHEISWLVREAVGRHDGVYDGWGSEVQT